MNTETQPGEGNKGAVAVTQQEARNSTLDELRHVAQNMRDVVKSWGGELAWFGPTWAKRLDHCIANLEAQQSAQPVGDAAALLAAFPLHEDVDERDEERCCEWTLLQDRKRLHAILAAAPSAPSVVHPGEAVAWARAALERAAHLLKAAATFGDVDESLRGEIAQWLAEVTDDAEPAPAVEARTVDEVERVALIDRLVTAFLGWRLPDDFAPDGGVSFKPIENPNDPTIRELCWPVGTNLLTDPQARAMFAHCLAAAGTQQVSDDAVERALKAFYAAHGGESFPDDFSTMIANDRRAQMRAALAASSPPSEPPVRNAPGEGYRAEAGTLRASNGTTYVVRVLRKNAALQAMTLDDGVIEVRNYAIKEQAEYEAAEWNYLFGNGPRPSFDALIAAGKAGPDPTPADEPREKDAARLNWLESQFADGVHVEGCYTGSWDQATLKRVATVFYGSREGTGSTIREAIDAARAGGEL